MRSNADFLFKFSLNIKILNKSLGKQLQQEGHVTLFYVNVSIIPTPNFVNAEPNLQDLDFFFLEATLFVSSFSALSMARNHGTVLYFRQCIRQRLPCMMICGGGFF